MPLARVATGGHQDARLGWLGGSVCGAVPPSTSRGQWVGGSRLDFEPRIDPVKRQVAVTRQV